MKSKHHSPLTVVLATILLFLSFSSSLMAAAKPGVVQGVAIAAEVNGAAWYSDESGKQIGLKEGMELRAGMTVITGNRATVVLNLGDNGQTVSMRPGSELAIGELTKNQSEKSFTTKMEIKKGSILGNVKKISARSNYGI